MEITESKSKILLFIEIGGDCAAFVLKFAIGILGRSSVMIAESFHSLVDTANQIFLLIGIEMSKKPADADHPFGYGKERFFWAFLSALFILEISGSIAILSGINQIRKPDVIIDFGASFLVLGITFCFQIVSLSMSTRYYLKLIGKMKGWKDLFLKMKFVKESTAINLWLGDIVSVIGSLLAAFALYLVMITGNVLYDGIASIIIGIVLAVLGLFLIYDTKKLLIGEAVSPAMYNKIIDLIMLCPEVKSLIKLKTMHFTPNEILINADIEFRDDLETSEIAKAVDRIENLIRDQIPAAKHHISIEVEARK